MKTPPKLPLSKKWKNVFKSEYKFKYIEKCDEIPENALWTTSCSKTKSGRKRGLPEQFYKGKYNLLFYKFMNRFNFKYGILSDKYGIHMYNEKLDYYDIHPSKLTIENKQELGKKIKEKAQENNFDKMIFYYPSPLQSKPYFDMLWYSELSVYYISSIKLLND